MEITSAEKSKKNPGRYKVYVDDRYSFSINEEDFIRLGLYEKKEITEDEIAYIKDTINFNSAKAKGIRYLSLSLRSAGEVRAKLCNEGFDGDTSDRVVEELKSIGYINDRMYAQKYIFDRSKLKPRSKRLIRVELLNKGIDSGIVDEVLEGWEVDDSSIAQGLVKRKFGKYDMRDEEIIKKIYTFLKHRGFNYDIISDIIDKIKRDSL